MNEKRASALKLITFALDSRRTLVGLKDEYLEEIRFIKEIDENE